LKLNHQVVLIKYFYNQNNNPPFIYKKQYRKKSALKAPGNNIS